MLTKSKYNTLSLPQILVGAFVLKETQCYNVFLFFIAFFFFSFIISEAGIIPTAIYTSLPPHQLPFIVLSSSLAKVLIMGRFPQACSAVTCSHIQRRFRITGFGAKWFWAKGTMEGTRGQWKTYELLKQDPESTKTQISYFAWLAAGSGHYSRYSRR